MRELLELQSGQVAFISGLMSGFSLSVAVHVLRSGMRKRMAKIVFLMFLLSSLLFLVALYTDVRLGIELTGRDALAPALADKVAMIRFIGTGCATIALFLFVLATAMLGWLATPIVGLFSTVIGLSTLAVLWFIRHQVSLVGIALTP